MSVLINRIYSIANAGRLESKSRFKRYLLIISCFSLVASISSYNVIFAYLLLSLWALRGGFCAFQALSLSWLLTMFNPTLIDGSGADVMRWVVIVMAMFRVILGWVYKISFSKFPRFLLPIIIFLIFAIISSALKSYALDVSLFKLLMYVGGLTTLILVMQEIEKHTDYIDDWLSALFCFIIFISFPLYFLASGYVRNERVFQGVLNHPQAFGIFLAISVAWFLSRCIFEKERSAVFLLAIVLGGWFLLETLARTALLAILLGFLSAGLVRVFLKVQDKKQWIYFIVVCLVFLALILLGLPSLREYFANIIFKGQEDVALGEAFESSRGFLIARSYDNFKENPLLGIGFGLASDPTRFDVTRDPVFGLPLGAAVEKGFAIVAILEELGIFGLVCISWFLFLLIKPLINARTSVSLVVFLVCLFVNFGESIMLSVSGMGLFMWLVLIYVSVARR